MKKKALEPIKRGHIVYLVGDEVAVFNLYRVAIHNQYDDLFVAGNDADVGEDVYFDGEAVLKIDWYVRQ